MKRLIFLFILLFALPVHAQMLMGNVGSAAAGGTETIGYQVAGDTAVGEADNYMYCQKMNATPAHNGTVDSIITTLSSSTGTRKTVLSIYNHDATNNLPSTVVANSSTTELTLGSSPADVSFTYTTKPTVTAGAQYWVCHSDPATGGTNNRYTTATASRCAYKAITYNTFPDWAGTYGIVLDNVTMGKAYFVYSY